MASPVVISLRRSSASGNISEKSERILAVTVEALKSLNLEYLDETWVRNIWNDQFTECQEIDDDYERNVDVDIAKTLQKVSEEATKWLKLNKDEDLGTTTTTSINQSNLDATGEAASSKSGFWTSLINDGIAYKALIALMFYYMETGQKYNASPIEREKCLRATGLYFILLGIPGSGAFKIFHPVLYNKALDTFKLTLKLHLVKASPKKKNRGRKGQRTQPSQSQRPRKRNLSRAGSTCSGNFSDLDSDESDDDDGTLSPGDVQHLTNGLNNVLYNFLTMLDFCPLKRSPESLELTIQELVELTHLETGFASLDFGRSLRKSDLSALSYNAYSGLEKLCKPLHGNVTSTVKLIFKFLLPGILMTHRGSSEISPKGLAVIREHSLHFTKHIMASVGEPSNEAVTIMIQHLAMKVPDKAEFRQKASNAIITLLIGLPSGDYTKMVRWFFMLAHNEKSAQRIFALEVMGRLLAENERKKPAEPVMAEHDYGFGGPAPEQPEPEPAQPDGDVQEEPMETQENGLASGEETPQPPKTSVNVDLFSSHKYLFGVIFSRCKDITAMVRSKALQTLADVTATASDNPIVADVITNMFESQASGPSTPGESEPGTVDFVELLQDPEADLSSLNPLPSSEAFIDFLRQRALDESVYVRKNALQVLENILKFYAKKSQNLEPLALELVGILAEHCRDPSLLVRKQIVHSLTEILKAYPENDAVVSRWVDGVFPLILDVEQKAADKVLECIWEVLFGNLVPYHNAALSRHFLPWKILMATDKLKMTKYLSRACGQWSKEEKLKPGMLKVLKTHVGTENANSAWLLLAQITGHVPLQDPQYVMDFFNNSIHTPEGVGLYTLLQVLRVLLASVSKLDRASRKSLQKDLLTLVERFAIPPELISTAVDIATIVSWLEAGGGNEAYKSPLKNHPKSPPTGSPQSGPGSPPGSPRQTALDTINLKAYHHLLDAWAYTIIGMIDAELGQKILQPQGQEIEDTRMMRQIFTLGELAQICPHRINKRMFLLMQGIIFQQGTKHRKRKDLPTSQTQSNEPVQCAFTPTTKLQALSVITLAKMCLQNEDMAKRVVPAFGRLLDTTTDSALKNNIMFALSDMCVRYASLVDPLLPQMTACLKDPVLVVRRTTLTTLIHLLQEDYLKMNSNFFFRILQTLCDPSDEIKDLTTFYIQQRLIKRKPKIMYSNFIESLFHFNGYEGHESYNKFLVSERERQLFSMAGKEHQQDRMKLYKFMLEHMDDVQRFQTTFKVCKDILNGVVEGTVKLTRPSSYELLQDSLSCLASDEIKLASLKSKQDDDAAGMEPVGGGGGLGLAGPNEAALTEAVKAAAQKAIISKVQKTNIIENIVPIVIALKRKLDEAKSPLIDDLMTYLRELMKDYKNEVKEILSADKQLATEIQYDLKKWEEEMEARRQRIIEEQGEDLEPRSSEDQEQMLRAVIQTAVATIRNRKQLSNSGGNDAETGSDMPAPSSNSSHHHQTDNLGQFLELNLPSSRTSRKPSTGVVSNASEPIPETPTEQDDTPTEEEAIASFNPKIVLEKVPLTGKKSTATPASSDAGDQASEKKGKNLTTIAEEEEEESGDVQEEDKTDEPENKDSADDNDNVDKETESETVEEKEKESIEHEGQPDENPEVLEEPENAEEEPMKKVTKKTRKAPEVTSPKPVREKRGRKQDKVVEEDNESAEEQPEESDEAPEAEKEQEKPGKGKRKRKESEPEKTANKSKRQSSRRSRVVVDISLDEEESEDPKPRESKETNRKRKRKETGSEDQNDDIAEVSTNKPKGKRGGRTSKQKESEPEPEVIEAVEEEEEATTTKPAAAKASNKRKSRVVADISTEEEEKKGRRRSKSAAKQNDNKDNNSDDESNWVNVSEVSMLERSKRGGRTPKKKVISGEFLVPKPATPPVTNQNTRNRKRKGKNDLRAISTPNKSQLKDNVTFMDDSAANISAIPVLSPPTPARTKAKKAAAAARASKKQESFQFMHGKRGRDLFEELTEEPAAKKVTKVAKKPQKSPESPQNSSRSSRSRRQNPKYK